MRGIDVKRICNALHISETALHVGIKEGSLPFGAVIGDRTYTLFPPKVLEYCGIDISEGEDESLYES